MVALLRKGCEKMKKLIAVLSAVLLVGCIAVLFYGCGAKDEDITTTTERITTTVPDTTRNAGVVTDESVPGDNGVIGDIVTDISEGVSDMVTDMSENARNMMR